MSDDMMNIYVYPPLCLIYFDLALRNYVFGLPLGVQEFPELWLKFLLGTRIH